MSGHSPEEMKRHVRSYVMVYFGLLALTFVTVKVADLHLPVTLAVLVALTVATFKGAMVAGIFMHLKNEKKAIYWILILTFVLAVGFVIPALMDWEYAHYLARHIKH